MARISTDEALYASAKFMRRRGLAPGATSTLLKAMRGQRIKLGERQWPRRTKPTEERVTGRFVFNGTLYERVAVYVLLPTGGWKVDKRFLRKAA